MSRRAWMLCGVGIYGLGVVNVASAQGFPAKAIRFIVPFAAGGETDLMGRAISQRLSDALGQPIVVDNRTGAGGVIGSDVVAKAPPDGYTLLMGSPGPLTINPNLTARMPYNLKDFSPITLATSAPFILTMTPSVPVTSVKELIALAKAKPNTLNFGSAGIGSVSHLSGEQFKALTGVQIAHVPYRGSSPALADLIGGQVQAMFSGMQVMPYIKSGQLRALAVTSAQRSTAAPEIPTMIEAGVPGYEAGTAFGVLAPAKTPHDIIARLNLDIVKIMRSPAMKERLAEQGMETVGSTPEQYARHLREELARYAKVVKTAGVRIE